MPIQFHCSSCGQPIEVDDEHAGQAAACPYCRQLVTVPPQSTYYPSEGAAARPAGPDTAPPPFGPASAEPPGGPALGPPPITGIPPAPPGPDRQRTARTYGKYALVCAGLVVVLLVILLISGMVLYLKLAGTHPRGSLTFEDVTKEMQNMPGAPLITGLDCGVGFFALVGLVLAIVSLTQSRTRSWQGWVALGICGGAVLCLCGMLVLTLVAFAGGGVHLG
jgi:DNA-directed RNA polymerase subunit RPC12/RpoP